MQFPTTVGKSVLVTLHFPRSWKNGWEFSHGRGQRKVSSRFFHSRGKWLCHSLDIQANKKGIVYKRGVSFLRIYRDIKDFPNAVFHDHGEEGADNLVRM